MCDSPSVHVADGSRDLAKEISGQFGVERPVLLQVVAEFAALECFNDHCIVDFERFSFRADDGALWDCLDKLDDVRVALNSLQNLCVVHKDHLLVYVALIDFLIVGPLNCLDGNVLAFVLG